MTPQRLAVLEYLEGNKSHPSAEVVFRALKKKFPTISFATVYNILETLKEKGLVQELNIDPTRKRFDPDTSFHHHFYCISCSQLFDVEAVFQLSKKASSLKGFEVQKTQVNIYGLCPKCRPKKNKQGGEKDSDSKTRGL